MPGGVAPKFGSDKVSRYTGVSQLQLRVSRYTVQLSPELAPENMKEVTIKSKNGPFWAILALFSIFFVFSGSNPGRGGFCILGFLGSVAGLQDRKDGGGAVGEILHHYILNPVRDALNYLDRNM